MAICLPCAMKYNHTGELPEPRKHYNVIGWTGVCGKCNEQTVVYSNQDMGVNPDMRKDAPKH